MRKKDEPNKEVSNNSELLKWIKLMAKPQVRTLISQNLDGDLEAAVYELSDGTLSSRAISKKLMNQISHTTVTEYWEKWFKVGIVEPSIKFKGRFQKICSLEEVGLIIPPILKKSKPKKELKNEVEKE